MKRNVRPATKKDFDELKTPAAKKILKHVLSPLEQAVILHNSKPFKFKFSGVFVYVSGFACKQLLLDVTQKLHLVNHLMQKDRLSPGIAFALRETLDDPAEVLSLNPRLRNRLCRIKCYTMFAIMQKGKQYFHEQNFSDQFVRTIQALFAKHGCSNLFK
jgi:hypothetical protein